VTDAHHQGTVYCIACDGAIKVGFSSSDVNRRRQVLQSGNHLPMTIVFTLPGSQRTERRCHRVLKRQFTRLRGEWYEPNPSIEPVVRMICKNPGDPISKLNANAADIILARFGLSRKQMAVVKA